MLQRSFIITLLGLCVSLNSFAYQLKAHATDSIGQDIPYATFRIYAAEADSLITSNVASEAGLIAASLPDAGDYRLSLAYTGMEDADFPFSVSLQQPIADLGDVVMTESPEMLDGITVTAKKPLVIRQIDRIQYDVQADPIATTAPLNEVLRKVPMVSVDADGTIRVNGSTDFKIYKNNRPSNSMSRNSKDLFAALPASSIKRIEVITDPGAEFDAEGSSTILNIITNDNATINGVMGSATLRYNSEDNTLAPNLYLTSEIKNVTFTVWGGYNSFNNKRNRSHDVADNVYSDGSTRHSEGKYHSNGNIEFFGGEASYQLDTLNLFTAEANGYVYSLHSNASGSSLTCDALGNTLGSFSFSETSPKYTYTDIDANFNYQHKTHRPDETYTLSYMLSHTNQRIKTERTYDDFFGSDTQPYSGHISDYRLKFFEHTVQADYTRKFGGIHTLSTGLKGIFRINRSNNDYQYIDADYLSSVTVFHHTTDIGAAYAQYAVRLGKFNIRSGLRYEYSYLKATYPEGDEQPFSARFNDLVPSIGLNYQINDANTITANFNTAIQRPGIAYLNPAVKESATSINFGNANLASAVNRSIKLNYSLYKPKFNMQASIGYQFCNDAIASYIYTNEQNKIVSTYGNIGDTRDVYASAFFQWSPSEKTSFTFNGRASYKKNSQQFYSLDGWPYSGYFSYRQQLPWKLDFEAAFYIYGGNINGVYSRAKPNFTGTQFHYLHLSRRFLKGDRLSVGFDLQNIFGSHNSKYTTQIVQGDYTGSSTSFSRQPVSINAFISYRFGSLNASVKKTEHSITNDDLQGRK